MTDQIKGNELIGVYIGNDIDGLPNHESYHPATYRFHCSWDWQVPAWSKAIQEAKEIGSNQRGLSEQRAIFQKQYAEAVHANNAKDGFQILVSVIKWIEADKIKFPREKKENPDFNGFNYTGLQG